MKSPFKIAGLCALLSVSTNLAVAQQQSTAERVAALKASLAASQAVLKQYEWIETTVVSLKGEEKSRKQNRCNHGADGGVTKVPLSSPPPAKKKRGLRGKIVANKTEELTDYMQQAVALVQSYVPPNPALNGHIGAFSWSSDTRLRRHLALGQPELSM